MRDPDPILEAASRAADAFTEACGQHGISVVYALTREVENNEGCAVVSTSGSERHLLPVLSALVQHFRGAYPVAHVVQAIHTGMQNALDVEKEDK